MASADTVADSQEIAFTVERVRIDEEAGQSLISGADDEEEPAGYFIVDIDATGATLEFLGEDLSQRDGVQSLEIGPDFLAFTLDPASAIGAQMPRVRVTSREPIGPAVRAAEEKNGLVRWLRPDHQITKLGAKAPKAKDEHVGSLDVVLPETAERLRRPADGLKQIRLVRDLLAKAPAPAASEAIASVFDGRASAKRRERVTEVLETLVATGLARTDNQAGRRTYFLPR